MSETWVLGNGLRVVAESLPHLSTTSFCLMVGIGSRHEDDGASGLTHLLEHVLFRGCAGYPDAQSFNAAFEACGSALDAATSRDMMTFEASTIPGALHDALGLLGAMVTAPGFAESDVALERSVIVEELQDELDDRGRDVDVDNIAKRAMFGRTGLGRKIGGDVSDLTRLTAADCRAWHQRFFCGENMTLSVTGPLDLVALREVIEAGFGELPAGRAAQAAAEPTSDGTAFTFQHRTGGSQSDLQLAWRLPALRGDVAPVLNMLQRLLDDGTSSRLRHRLVDDLGIAYHVGAALEEYEELSVLTIETQTLHRSVIDAVDAIIGVVGQAASQLATAQEVRSLRARLEYERRALADSSSGVAYLSGHDLLRGRSQPWRDRLRRAAEVEPSTIAACARDFLSPLGLHLTVVGDLGPVQRAALRRRAHRWRGQQRWLA